MPTSAWTRRCNRRENGNDGTISTWYYNAGAGLNDGQWHHIAATKSGSTVKIYVDGNSVGFGVGTAGVNPNNRIGAGYHGDFVGSVDELALWSRALTESEVQALFLAGSSGTCKVVDTPPTADAGVDFSVDEGQPAVSLDGSGSSDPDGDPLTHSWLQLGGTRVTL